MTTYQKFKKLKIDFSAIGLEPAGSEDAYFCTPKGARIIARAGVDGIHYCFVRNQGEMVFAVSPMNDTGKNVFPIAYNFDDLLSLLMACGSMDAIEQAWQWDEEQFEDYLEANPAGPGAMEVFAVLKDKLGALPMENPFSYLQALQNSYNYGELTFSKEYYDNLYAMPADEMPSVWKVTMDPEFRPERGKPAKEVTLNKAYMWGNENWLIPSVYVCSTGLVADFCIQLDEDRLKKYFEKEKSFEQLERSLTYEERLMLEGENPLSIGFSAEMIMNGEVLHWKSARSLAYVPENICGNDNWQEAEALWVLSHYNLDLSKAWVVRRCTFPWEERRTVHLESLDLKLERDRTNIPGSMFYTPAVADSVKFTHPVSGKEHVLTVREYELQEIDPARFHDDEIEFPRYLAAMIYTLSPDIEGGSFMIKDCNPGDRPRMKNTSRGMMAVSFGMVAGASIKPEKANAYSQDGIEVKPHAVCSSAHFEPVQEPVQWRIIFCEKMMEDIMFALI